MSGGVDSSVVAGLDERRRLQCNWYYFKTYMTIQNNQKKEDSVVPDRDILDAKRVSEKLNINHKILFYQKKFKSEVIDSFIDSYAAGETPIPCVQCNQTVKFRDLFKYSKELNADALNYWSLCYKNSNRMDRANMYRAKDKNRDQSYFLFSTSQEQLNFLDFRLEKLKNQKLEIHSFKN